MINMIFRSGGMGARTDYRIKEKNSGDKINMIFPSSRWIHVLTKE